MLFAGRLAVVQIIDGPEMAAQARAERSRIYPIKALRGKILDATGKEMATSVKRYNIGVNQKKINTFTLYDEKKKDSAGKPLVLGTGPAAAAQLLAPILKQDPAVLGGKMVADDLSTFVYIARFVEPDTWRKIKALGIPGIEPEEVFKRVYPNKNIGGNIVGFTDIAGTGLAGLELSQEDKLRGVDGKGQVEIGRTGRIIPVADQSVVDAEPGWDVHTSIHIDLQGYCQEQIDKTTADTGARWSAAMVQEVKTGRVLALCDSHTVDSSLPGEVPAEDRGSRAVSVTYEPGSTVKLSTFATALDAGVITPTTPFTVPYEITMPNGQSFVDSSRHATMRYTAAGVLAQSSNVGTVQIGDMVKDSARYQHLVKLGFGHTTGIELPSESAGLLDKWNDWDGRQRYTTMFGQGMAGTLLQTTGQVQAIANGGKLISPRIIDYWVKPDGTKVPQERPKAQQVMKPETAKILMKMMQGVVSEGGTSPNAALDGYLVAGKSGTSQIISARGVQEGTVGSFIGVIPADRPEVVISVVVYRPTSNIFGTVVAMPAFKSIATATMRELGVSPSNAQPDIYPLQAG